MKIRRCILFFNGITAMAPSNRFIDRETNEFFDIIYFINPITNKEVTLNRTKLHKYSQKNLVYIQEEC